MSEFQTTIIALTLIGFLIFIVVDFMRKKNYTYLLINAAILILIFLVLKFYFNFPSSVEPRSGIDQWDMLLLYILTLLGMVAHYFYDKLTHEGEDFKFSFKGFIRPLIVSPLIFYPLLSLFDLCNFELNFTTPAGIIMYFIAFQNGYFWKSFFERQL